MDCTWPRSVNKCLVFLYCVGMNDGIFAISISFKTMPVKYTSGYNFSSLALESPTT